MSVAEQLLHEFDDQCAAERLAALYDTHGTPVEMVRARAEAGCSNEDRRSGAPRRLPLTSTDGLHDWFEQQTVVT